MNNLKMNIKFINSISKMKFINYLKLKYFSYIIKYN